MFVENVKKVFTNDGSNIIIKKNYNLLNKDYKKICEREGLYMKETKDIKLKEVIEELNLIEKIFFKKKFIKIYRKGMIDCFNYYNKDGTF